MKHAKIISRIFGISAIVLACAMCVTVAYEFCEMQWAGRYYLTSAPPWVAFFLAIPFLFAIAVCVILYLVFRRRVEQD